MKQAKEDQPKKKKAVKPTPTDEPEVKAVAQPKKRVHRVKCVWSGVVKVSGNNTPSGKPYSFQPGQEQTVDELDYNYLIGLTRGGAGCCSGSGTPQKYFVAGG